MGKAIRALISAEIFPASDFRLVGLTIGFPLLDDEIGNITDPSILVKTAVSTVVARSPREKLLAHNEFPSVIKPRIVENLQQKLINR